MKKRIIENFIGWAGAVMWFAFWIIFTIKYLGVTR